MAVTITVSDVREEYPDLSEGFSDRKITALIALVDQADMCLDANNVPDSLQECAKLAGVAFNFEVITESNETSTRSANGDAITLDKANRRGIDKYAHGLFLQTLGVAGQCVIDVMGDPGGVNLFIGVSGPTYENRGPIYEQNRNQIP